MGQQRQQIIQQPNGRYCVYSSIVDNVTYYDLDRDELVQAFLECERKSIESDVDRVLQKLKRGQKPYYQFTMDYPEMLASIEGVHGEDDVSKLTELLAKAQRDREGADDAGN